MQSFFYTKCTLLQPQSNLQIRPSPGVRQSGAHIPSSQEMYAASKESFHERIKEDLDIEVIQAPLTRENYKKKFHNMICWEEKKHIEILDKK